MKNLIYSFLLVIMFSLSFIASVAGQYDEFNDLSDVEIDRRQNTVISPNGLSIRKSPGIKSKRLAVVPFGEKVSILDTINYGWDSLGIYTFDWGGKELTDHPILGQWVKVKYKKNTGYMFNTYLFNKRENRGFAKGLNKDFAILYPGIDCRNNIVYQPDMHWYGVYRKEGKLSLIKTTIGFFRTYDWMSTHGITTSDNKDLVFIFGTKTTLTEKEMQTFYRPRYSFEPKDYYLNEENREALNAIGIEWENIADYENLIFLKQGKKRQRLNPEGIGSTYQVQIRWVGDLDQDGKLDFIIHYGEKSAETVLYLSSQAEQGQLVKAVAVYFSGYCC